MATLSFCVLGGSTYSQSGQADPHVLALMHDINQQLRASGVRMAAEQIEFFTIGEGRPTNAQTEAAIDRVFDTWQAQNAFKKVDLIKRADSGADPDIFDFFFGFGGFGDPFLADIKVPLPGIDVETVALHESGHSLGVGHFGPPPAALMNPVYAGIRQTPFALDRAGMQAIWGSWPK